MQMHPNIEKLIKVMDPINTMSSIGGVIFFDQKTVMPENGAPMAAKRIGFMSEMEHAAFTKDEVGEAISQCLTVLVELPWVQQLIVKRMKMAFDMARALPAEFVGRRDQAQMTANQAWKHARAADDYSTFMPQLAIMFDLAREEAGYRGAGLNDADSVYDAMMSTKDPGMTAKVAAAVLSDVGAFLTDFVRQVKESGVTISDAPLRGCFSEGRQRRFFEWLIAQIGYDFSSGVVLKTTHPFAGTIAHGDHRITTRFYEDFLSAGLFGTLHESGHAMFDMGCDPFFWQFDNRSLPAPMGLHESQSRMWENMVGRSMAFWSWAYPYLQLSFPKYRSVKLEDFYRAINRIQPSAIRVEADEVTYNGHIQVRYEIERGLLSGSISLADAPQAFADLMEKYVGYRPATLKDGILQDVHWSMGHFGYFPSYTFGNLAAAQLFYRFSQSNPAYAENFRRGDFSILLSWLRANIHSTGLLETTNDVLMRVTGEPLNAAHWKTYVTKKFSPVYGLN
ncbi:MAG: carboxypeptidase M32 [Patescibacteria group bacterium]